MAYTILVIDDEEGIRQSLQEILEDEGYEVLTAETADEGKRLIEEFKPDLIFLDIWLPDRDGIELLEDLKNQFRDIPVVIISGHGTIEQAVKATKLGAYDFLEKPLSLERVLLTAQRALERGTIEKQFQALTEDLQKQWQIVGSSRAIKQLKEQIQMVAQTPSRVLITGESGVGKELVARTIHQLSPRAKGPFVEVNCAAIPQELIESELFGHEKGSFTGAYERKKGKFELADGGTLFLDEVADMSLQTQAKVLRAIETQQFQRVGGSKDIKVDVRIIAATNKDLKREIEEGRFREDLYFRLNVIQIHVPPLRQRKEDIPELVDHFLELLSKQYGWPKKRVSKEVINKFMAYDWPGNVRELKNAVERLMIMTTSDEITEKDLALVTPSERDYFIFDNLKQAKEAFERDFILRKLEENDFNISRTAQVLGIERSYLHRKIKQYNLKIPH